MIHSQIAALRLLTHELITLGFDGEPVYADRLRQLNTDVYNQADTLYCKTAQTDEEEAALCDCLLKAFATTLYNHGNKELKMQQLLQRSEVVLQRMPHSLLKCRLLVTCHGITLDEELAQMARIVMQSWPQDTLTAEQQELIAELNEAETANG